MRKCVSCGYLVLGDADACKHCGAILPAVVTAPLAAPVLVPVGAPAAPAVPPVPPPFTRPPVGAPVDALPPPPLGDDYWSAAPPVPVGPAPRRRSRSRALLGLVVVSMLLGWVAYGHLRNSLPPGTSDFVAGHGVAYSSPDHTFDAQFPSAPTLQHQVIPVASTAVTINLAQSQTDDYEVVAASMVLPVAVPAGQVQTIVHEVLNEATASQGATIESEAPVDRNGATGVEVRAKVRDGYAARFIVLVSGNRVYLLGAHAKRGTDRLYDALLASLSMH
jgi:hypothetical protein